MAMLKVSQKIMKSSTEVMISIMELCAATCIIVVNTLFKQRKKPSHISLVICLGEIKKKFVKKTKMSHLVKSVCMTQHRALVYELKTRYLEDTKRMNIPRRKIWKLHWVSIRRDFSSKRVQREEWSW